MFVLMLLKMCVAKSRLILNMSVHAFVCMYVVDTRESRSCNVAFVLVIISLSTVTN